MDVKVTPSTLKGSASVDVEIGDSVFYFEQEEFDALCDAIRDEVRQSVDVGRLERQVSFLQNSLHDANGRVEHLEEAWRKALRDHDSVTGELRVVKRERDVWRSALEAITSLVNRLEDR